MVNQRITCIILLVLSTLAILACLVINFEAWIVYTVAIFGIPTERVKEPFTGY